MENNKKEIITILVAALLVIGISLIDNKRIDLVEKEEAKVVMTNGGKY